MDRSIRARRRFASGIVVTLVALVGALSATASAAPLSGVDLSTYVRVARYNLPEPTRTPAPPNNLLAQEASAVTYDWDTGTLFVVGDGGTAIVQVSKTGALFDTMTFAPGGSPQGTEFYDPEGLAYVGGGKFVFTEERDRQVNRFTYVAGATLHRADAQTVKLGTFVGNVGLEGVTNDPQSGGLILVKEKTPESIFQTGVDFAAGTATNGSPTTDASTNLFDPALLGLADFADVFSLSNLTTLSGPDASHLLVLSQESARIVNTDRSGNVSSSLTIVADPGDPLSVVDMQHEGVTMDDDGVLYVANENGGGDADHPQLWVYKHSDAANAAPTGVTLTHQVATIPENTGTAERLKVADVVVADDGLGTNNLSVSGPDAASFEVDNTGLYIKAGTVLDFETKSSYSVTVDVDDPALDGSPDASAPFSLAVSDQPETPVLPTIIVSEVAPWGSGNAPYAADWFEVTNTGSAAVSVVGWKMDDNSNAFASAVALRGITTIPGGTSVIFLEGTATGTTDATIDAAFSNAWFGSPTPPIGLQIGNYGGSGVGLATGGDAVNVFDGSGARMAGIQFGVSDAISPFQSFDNTAGLSSTTLPPPAVSALSEVGVNGAFLASDGIEVGSPGRDMIAPVLTVPADITAEAASADGAHVSYSASATDGVDPSVTPHCTPASGSVFALGTTTVTCTATDAAGNAATKTFHVTVRDTTPPDISNMPADITSEAVLPAAHVSYTNPTATDLVDGSVTPVCVPASGALFALGTTTVTCTARDAADNSSSATFKVKVVDTTAPVVTVPADITTDATGPGGATVTYNAGASDIVGVTSFSCSPASGSTFAIGTTTVTCSASDAAANSSSKTFKVTVTGAQGQILALKARVLALPTLQSSKGRMTASQLTAKLDDAYAALNPPVKKSVACTKLNEFISVVTDKTGTGDAKIPAASAAALIADARRIRAVIGC